jgi:hypothetical protein
MCNKNNRENMKITEANDNVGHLTSFKRGHICVKITGVHLHLIYVYACENPLFNGGGYLPSFVEYILPYK